MYIVTYVQDFSLIHSWLYAHSFVTRSLISKPQALYKQTMCSQNSILYQSVVESHMCMYRISSYEATSIVQADHV